MLCFAYGSNLDAPDLDRFCREHGFAPGCIRAVGTALLPDVELAFTCHSPRRRGGVLDLRERPGQAVHGALLDANEEGWRALDRKEGAGPGGHGGYARHTRLALTRDGDALPVIVYEVADAHRQPFVAPHDDYLRVVARGLAAHALDDAMLHAAARDAAHALPTLPVFVYGTLLAGEHNHGVIAAGDIVDTRPATIAGRLFDSGDGYPAIQRAPAGEGARVRGELVSLARLPRAMAGLDRLEGFAGFDAPGNLYERRLVEVDAGTGETVLAWTYVASAPKLCATPIDSGCWRTHRRTVPERVPGRRSDLP
jgi:gamma-glutamylcyclotransferase (GGCT)/AIG2-like uncharacterized protein YtfP